MDYILDNNTESILNGFSIIEYNKYPLTSSTAVTSHLGYCSSFLTAPCFHSPFSSWSLFST